MKLLTQISGLICILGGVASTLVMVYSFIFMLGCARPETKRQLPMLGPLILFLPSLWSEEGNRARMRVLISVCVFAVCYVCAAFIVQYVHPLVGM
ncbi:hypothetical protein ACQR1I_11185 [Bradyrhizobium sp. HKCCYLS2038]|uniref:hypothetical protein n=1 Tax=unclassified Bradyrhizobium TaxID=2631580 RepID=UPI003EBB563D